MSNFKRITSWIERTKRDGYTHYKANYYATDDSNTGYFITVTPAGLIELDKFQNNGIAYTKEFDTVEEAKEYAELN